MRSVIWSFTYLLILFGTLSGAQANPPAKKVVERSADLLCLAQNIYFEARGEPVVGKIAVGHVVLNRAADRRFPTGICSVIRQGGEKRLHRCQFSWWCDGLSDMPRDRMAWQESIEIAKLIRDGHASDPTNGALWYHAVTVRPYWADHYERYTRIGAHIFYIDPKKVDTQIADATTGE